MTSTPFTSWQIDGETMETVTDFTFGGSTITVDGDLLWMVTSKMLAPWKKGYDKPRQALKSRDITLPTKLWFLQ